jgi:hypothetical protein
MEISSTIDLIYMFSLVIGATYFYMLVALYYFSSGKSPSIFFWLYWPRKEMDELQSRWSITLSLMIQLAFLFLFVGSVGRLEFKIIITAIYVLSTGWLFWTTNKKYMLRTGKNFIG